jgi:hypothetical protein
MKDKDTVLLENTYTSILNENLWQRWGEHMGLTKPKPKKNPENDRIEYRLHSGGLHREGGPAVIYPDGAKVWFFNNVLHRVDGPAVEYPPNEADGYPDGYEEYWLAGKQYPKDKWEYQRQRFIKK